MLRSLVRQLQNTRSNANIIIIGAWKTLHTCRRLQTGIKSPSWTLINSISLIQTDFRGNFISFCNALPQKQHQQNILIYILLSAWIWYSVDYRTLNKWQWNWAAKAIWLQTRNAIHNGWEKRVQLHKMPLISNSLIYSLAFFACIHRNSVYF